MQPINSVLTDIHNNTFPFIKEQVPLHNKNWFSTGGYARFYAAPKTITEFEQALLFAQKHALSYVILGAGANCLISDTGFDGLVIHPQMRTITHTHTSDTTSHVTAQAGAAMSELIAYCLEHDLIGLEEFSGIPGSVGGSVYINLHYFNFLLGQFISEATIFDTAATCIKTVPNSWFAFGYDYSQLHEKKQFLLDATFSLKRSTPLETAFAKGRSQEIIRHRLARYPHKNTCGSFFRNFHEHEVTITNNGKKMIYAAYYLDKIGAKGSLRAGNAQVSHQHANMIVHAGDATSDHIVQLAKEMQKLVFEQFGIILQPECELIGFETYPLHSSKTLLNTKTT